MEVTATPGDLTVPGGGQFRRQIGKGFLRARPPGPTGIVAELVRFRGQDPVCHSAAGDDLPVLIDSQRLYRRRADIDAHRQ